jgi:phytoene synthase
MQPGWPERDFATPADLAACRALLRTGSRTFFAASLFLPDAVRAPACALYAFCRLADDAVDLDPANADAALAALYRRLERAYAGEPETVPVDRALADVVRRYAIPRALPEALLEGFAWDAAGRRYGTLAEVEAYGARVAGTVGAMMAMLMGVREPGVLARACDLGVAMQLSNIARDVGEDAGRGRVYLPLGWLAEAGIDPDALVRSPTFTPKLGGVVRRLLEAADVLYRRAEAGIAALPAGCRTGIMAARLLYAEIGREVERNGFDSVSQRAVVPAGRKLQLLGRAAGAVVGGRPPRRQAPPLEATRFLVEAVAASPLQHGPVRIADRAGWVIGLFERLERRDRLARAGNPS